MEKPANESKTSGLPTSYHTFLYPFIYEGNLESIISRDTERWTQIHLHHLGKDAHDSDYKQRLLEFNEYQYFLPKARSLIFDENRSDIKTSITYKYKIDSDKALYTIVKKIDEKCINNIDELKKENQRGKGYYVTSYNLHINQLTLLWFPVFKTGIFSFELKYYKETGYFFLDYTSNAESEQELKQGTCKVLTTQEHEVLHKNLKKESIEQQINIINDYGRRVGIPCLKEENENTKVLLNADQIVISGLKQGDEETSIVIDFNVLSHNYDKVNLDIPTNLISEILFQEEKKAEGKSADQQESEPEKKESYTLEPVLDDRMFTACLYRKNQYPPIQKTFSTSLRNSRSDVCRSQLGEGDTYRYLEPELYKADSEMLYQFIFCEYSIACYNIHMMKDKLRDHVLGRWVEAGTIHAATEYSLVCVTGELDYLEKAVINPFLTIYVDMVKLALAQRAIITKIEYEGQQISNKINTQVNANHEPESVLTEVEKVWQKYISFENQIYLPEVTYQEQGVEIYDILKRSMRIKELNDYVKEGLINLHNIAILKAERNRIKLENAEQHTNDLISQNLNMLSIVGISLALITFVVNFISAGQMFSWDEGTNAEKYLLLSVLQLACIVAMLWFLYDYYHKKLGEHGNKTDCSSNGNKKIWFLYEKALSLIRKKTDGNTNGNKKVAAPADDGAIITKDTSQQYIDDIWKRPLIILFAGIVIIIVLKPFLIPAFESLWSYICSL